MTPSLRSTLSDFVGEADIHSAGGDALVLSVDDQAALESLVGRLNDLGIRIEQVTARRT